eukprot:scaffold4419_cov31-Tisochrysis_lutea.AAC.6
MVLVTRSGIDASRLSPRDGSLRNSVMMRRSCGERARRSEEKTPTMHMPTHGERGDCRAWAAAYAADPRV